MQLPRLKQSLLPIKSSNIKNITGGYLYFGCFNSLGSLNPYLFNNNNSSSSNFVVSSVFKNLIRRIKRNRLFPILRVV